MGAGSDGGMPDFGSLDKGMSASDPMASIGGLDLGEITRKSVDANEVVGKKIKSIFMPISAV